MPKMQIPLNGSNFISKDRQQAFQDALADDHQVNCREEPQLTVARDEPALKNENPQLPQYRPARQEHPKPAPEASKQAADEFVQAMQHTYNHQRRTMEIHQQYLAQQTGYIQLITSVLDQQGKALTSQDAAAAASMIEAFQRTLDNFHAIREQGAEIHREFLTQQTAFSERYLNTLENGHITPAAQIRGGNAPPPKQPVTEWVVQQPTIILDEKSHNPPAASVIDTPADAPPADAKAGEARNSAISIDDLASGLLSIVAEKTGYPLDMLDLDMDLEADLGIDSIKRVEILGSLEESFPSLPQPDMEVLSQTRTLQEILHYMEEAGGDSPTPPTPEKDESPIAAPAQSQEGQGAPGNYDQDLATILMEVVAEKTGYPTEMLELDMDMEADLGIDSIKRVEILGAMEERLPGLPAIPVESLAELRTLGQIVEIMVGSGEVLTQVGAETTGEKKKVDPPKLEKTPVATAFLPRPDHLDFIIAEDRPLILTSDGTDLTSQIWSALSNQGWKIILWEFPNHPAEADQTEAPPGATLIKQPNPGQDAIVNTLNSLRAAHGIPGGFIHLHPPLTESELFAEQEERIIKEVFFIAGALHQDLNQLVPGGRNLFLSITRTDGMLGIQNQGAFLEGSGLSGLVKSLGREWPDVFCRAIDFSREMDEAEISRLLLEEIHDPARNLPEIGRSPEKRLTIQRGNGQI